ncbi:uncharacterized protein SOCEGT47_068960 [Sorangium cellulosum]|uniref:Glucose/Sorbosone dehydrogenase domain-containing protein n=1 Tax=Sorangium cellulosum TaxID=56 RepID=A0A4P2Q9R3_SORCE|nr:uncharacterized protein SOCEGT47_068960 [Sorangium cellulosum]
MLPAALAGCSPRTKSPPIARPGPGCTLVEDGAGPPGAVAVKAETVVTGLEVPWGIAFLPGGDFLVTERPGRIRLVSRGDDAATSGELRGARGSAPCGVRRRRTAARRGSPPCPHRRRCGGGSRRPWWRGSRSWAGPT